MHIEIAPRFLGLKCPIKFGEITGFYKVTVQLDDAVMLLKSGILL